MFETRREEKKQTGKYEIDEKKLFNLVKSDKLEVKSKKSRRNRKIIDPLLEVEEKKNKKSNKKEKSQQDYQFEEKLMEIFENTKNENEIALSEDPNNQSNVDSSRSSKQKNSANESFNNGRWEPEEHQRFIEAILKYGNEWKKVQKHVGSRSSTQARSHAQKFFVKIKRTNLFNLDIDFNKSSIQTLQEVANQMNSDQYLNTIKKLHNIAFEKKSLSNVFPNGSGRKKKNFDNLNNSNSFISSFNSNFGSAVDCSFNNCSEIANVYTNNGNDSTVTIEDPNMSKIIQNKNYFEKSVKRCETEKSNVNLGINNITSGIGNTINTNNNFDNLKSPRTISQKTFQLPSNIKILSIKDEETNAFNNSFYNIDNTNANNSNKNIIINNNINNYNINITPQFPLPNFTQLKRPRHNSIDLLNDPNFHNSSTKFGVDDDFTNSFFDYFKGKDEVIDTSENAPANSENKLFNLNETLNEANNIHDISMLNAGAHVLKENIQNNNNGNFYTTNLDESFLNCNNFNHFQENK